MDQVSHHPKRSFLNKLGEQPRPDGLRDGLMQELLKRGVMLKLGVGTGNEERNYVAIERSSLDGAKLLIHGRDLFASEEAYRRFASGVVSSGDPEFMTLIHPDVLKKIEEFTSEHRWAQVEQQYRATDLPAEFDAKREAGITKYINYLKLAQRKEIEKDLYDAAKRLSDPYSGRFQPLEREMAQVIVQSLKPRVLRHILRSNWQFVIVDGKSEADKEFGYRSGIGGYYKQTYAREDDDLIVVFAPGMKKEEIARVTRHEVAHKQDLRHRQPFSERFAGEIDGYIAADWKNIDSVKARLGESSEEFPDKGLKEAERLFALYHAPDGQGTWEHCVTLLHTLYEIQARLQCCMPRDPAQPHPLYPTKTQQITEIPAILDELCARFGKPLIRELLPNLYKAMRLHSLSHPGLRDRPER